MGKREIKDAHKESCKAIATCEENRKKFVLNNATDFYKVQIDGGVVPEGEEPKCCDYYFFKDDEIEIFVELKGSDVKKAFLQIEQSIKDFSYKYPKKYAFVISSKMPTSTDVQKAMEKFKRSNKDVLLKVKTNKLECFYNSTLKDIEKIK